METSAIQTADGRWIAHRLIIARSFSDRLRGVLKHGELQPDTALLITPCSSIHTFAVPFSLDALFLSAQLRILRVAPNIAPWRVRWAPRGTKHVLELPAGTIDALQLETGVFVCLRSSTDECRRVLHTATRRPCSTAHVRFSLRLPREVRHEASLPPPRREMCARAERREITRA
jgi:uncharacterized membrane protein (UPF0127 family)